MKALRRTVRRRLTKPIARKVDAVRGGLLSITPAPARRPVERLIDYLDMMFVDHGIFRLFYANRHEVTAGVWRSSQPWPHQVRYCAKKGIRTIVNVRGNRDLGSYRLQQEACEKHGIKLVEFKLKSKAAPRPEAIARFESFFRELDYPILIHCKSGADRAGFAAALYLHLIEGEPLEEAKQQLHARFGHFKHAGTGILDHFFEEYSEYCKETPLPLLDWVENVYQPNGFKTEFRAGLWSSLLVDKILRRE